MSVIKNKLSAIRNVPLLPVGTLLLILLAVFLLLFSNTQSMQADSAMSVQVRFEGEWRIGDGAWQRIEEGVHIPATQGDVTLRGKFYSYLPNGEDLGDFEIDLPMAFYSDHIHLRFIEDQGEPYDIDHEDPLYGISACGEEWVAHTFSEGTEVIEIVVHNPHRYGNETAIDEMLSKVAIWGGIDFERGVLASGKLQLNAGLMFMIVSLVVLGTALYSSLLHVQKSPLLWLMGPAILFAGIYMAYSADGVSFWSTSIITNTTVLGCSMMFYMLFVAGIITCFLQKSRRIGVITTAVMGVADGLCFLLPVITQVIFYDLWLFWVIGQGLANCILMGLLVRDALSSSPAKRWGSVGLSLPLVAFIIDSAATSLGFWDGGMASIYVFFALVAGALVIVLRIIPEGINAAARARELELQRSHLEAEKNMIEAELKNSRVAIMISQIQPHFIYNTLGTIERMCLKNPEQAFELVRNFSLYLRGNFSELDSVVPIRFSEELKHVEYYRNIEKVRFPDIQIQYDVTAADFVLPALSVQPLVENAIKHGLMPLESGGSVMIRTYETDTHFCVTVEDNGVGFDTNLPVDTKKHVGLRNIRERLKVMVDGELILESAPNAGTRAIIKIPKEVSQ